MLVDSRGGCRDKGGSILLVGENILLYKARSIISLDIEIIHWKIAIIV